MARKKNIVKNIVLSETQRTIKLIFDPALKVVEISTGQVESAPVVVGSYLQSVANIEGTQFHFRLPSGAIIRAGRNPEQAAVVDLAQVLRGKAAADVPLEILDEARRQLGL